MIRTLVFSGTLLACALCGAQTIYQSTDKNDNPVYTDQPRPNAKPVELQPINTTPSVTPSGASDPESPAFGGYTEVQLDLPSSIPNGLAPTTIGIRLQPELQPGHRWQLLVDGQLQEEGTGTSVTIERLERGPHRFQLHVFDERGTLVGSAAEVEAFVYWPGGNKNPPRPGPKAP